jgi:TonB family protein
MIGISRLGAAMLVSAALVGCATQPTEVTHTVATTKVRPDPVHPIRIGSWYYPDESRVLHEEGVCKVKLTVAADSTIHDVSLTQSTGFPRLDQACVAAFSHGGLLPATQDGKPVTTTLEIPITWKWTAAPSK